MPTPLQQQRSGFSFEKSDAGGLRLDDDDSSPFCKARDFSYQSAFLSGTGLVSVFATSTSVSHILTLNIDEEISLWRSSEFRNGAVEKRGLH